MKILLRRSTTLSQGKRFFSTEGYKAIGSFHSENLDELMAQTDDAYDIPELPFDQKYSKSNPLDDFRYASDFLLDREKWTFLNHGAFGAALRVGYDRAEHWRYVFCVFNHQSFLVQSDGVEVSTRQRSW